MKNKRFYYTNPVAALWMMQNFNMEFESPVLGRDIPFIDLVQIIAIGMTRPILIKENSVSILEPRINDDVFNFVWDSFFQIRNERDLFAVNEAMKVKTEYEIVRRNRIIFHHPQMGNHEELGYI
jgi:hypothetical protein